MDAASIIGLSIIGGLWFIGVLCYVYAWIKTRTFPFQLRDDELFSKAFNVKEDDDKDE